jgi:hypothetical protein
MNKATKRRAMRARANATMRPYSFFSTSEQRIVNGKVVENKALASEYDGKKLRVKMCENGTNCKNKVFDMKKILAKPNPDLKNFFKTAKSKHKRSKHKQSKHKQSKRKTNKK